MKKYYGHSSVKHEATERSYTIPSPKLMKITVLHFAVRSKCIVTARIDLNHLLQLIDTASIIHTLSATPTDFFEMVTDSSQVS
jgi:hypothetical protein